MPLQMRYGDKEALRIAKEAGADTVDFGLENFNGRYDYRFADSIYSKGDEAVKAYFEDLRKYAFSIGLEISQTHGRGQGFKNIVEEDDALVENARLDCMATAALGAPVCVFHGVTTMNHMDVSPEFMRELNYEMFVKIIPFAKRYGIKIATETFGDVHGGTRVDFFGNTNEFIDTYNRICAVGDNKEYFTVCVDTGHSNKATRFNNNPSVPEVIRRIGKDVTVLHLNDNNTMGDQHLLPFVDKSGWQIDGTLDWDEIFSALKDIGYSGVYNMELHLERYGAEIMPEFCRFAVTVLRNFLSKRTYNN